MQTMIVTTDNSDVEHEKQTLRTREVELQHRTVTATTPLRSRIEALKRQGVVMSQVKKLNFVEK